MSDKDWAGAEKLRDPKLNPNYDAAEESAEANAEPRLKHQESDTNTGPGGEESSEK